MVLLIVLVSWVKDRCFAVESLEVLVGWFRFWFVPGPLSGAAKRKPLGLFGSLHRRRSHPLMSGTPSVSLKRW